MSITALAEHDYTKEAVDFSTICRTCAKHHDFLIPIFSGEGLQNNLGGVMNKYLPIKVLENDELPGHVCYQCAHTLLAWHELVTCCQKAEEDLCSRIAPTKHEQQKKTNITTNIKNYKKWATSSVNLMINEILSKDLHIEDVHKFFLHFVCQQCPNKPTSSDIEQLTEHINVAHLAETDGKKTLRNFLMNKISFEEPMEEFGSDSETGQEYTNADPGTATMSDKTHRDNLLDDKNDGLQEFKEDNSVAGTGYNIKLEGKLIKIEKNNMPLKVSKSERKATNDKVIEIQFRNTPFTNFHCHFCNSVFSSGVERKHHMKKEHNNSDDFKGKTCCEINYSKKDDYLKHYQESHMDEQEENTSRLDPVSGLTVTYHKTPVKRKRKKKPSQYNPVSCPHCTRVLCNKDSLRAHLKWHNDANREKERFFCNDCSRNYSSKGALVSHIKKEHLQLLPYTCKECGKAFDLKCNLRKHFLTYHSNELLYSCRICLQRFKARPGRRHMMRHVKQGLINLEDVI